MGNKLHFCIGGPCGGQFIDRDTARDQGYFDFNASSSGVKTIRSANQCLKRNIPCVPSMIWIHVDYFRNLTEKFIEVNFPTSKTAIWLRNQRN